MSVLVVAQSSSEILEGLMNNPVYVTTILTEFTWTSTIEPHVTMVRHRCSAPEDGSFVFRNMSGSFLYVILYVFLM